MRRHGDEDSDGTGADWAAGTVVGSVGQQATATGDGAEKRWPTAGGKERWAALAAGQTGEANAEAS